MTDSDRLDDLERRGAALELQLAKLTVFPPSPVMVCPTCGGCGTMGQGTVPLYCTTCHGYGTIGGRR